MSDSTPSRPSPDLAAAVARADAHAPFLRRLIARRPEVVAALVSGGLAAAIAAGKSEDDDLGVALRRERQAVALAVALADLAGAPLEQVTRALSDFADSALDRAIGHALHSRYPDAEPRGLAALALGKQGSRELNYSSDIDPILLYDPPTLPHLAREEPAEAAQRLTRAILALLQEPSGEGIVLRVDLRLRPASEAAPLAVPIDAAIGHYETSALPWERAAMIRARAAAGDQTLGDRFLGQIQPFVWRRGLDYGAIGEMRALSRRIRAHHAQVQALGPGYDVKRGRGGIREVEFFAQIHQLIHGGRDPGLRTPATLDALAALAAAGWIGHDEAATLADAYRLLRTIEHRLQMVEDKQTHRIPIEADAIDNVARLGGYADGAAMLDDLRPRIEAVGAIYDGLEGEDDPGLPQEQEALNRQLATLGFTDPGAAGARIAEWRRGSVRTTRSTAAREALEKVLPSLVEAIGRAPAADEGLLRFDRLIDGLPSALNLFRLLEARPTLVALLATILGHAPALASDLARRANLLDGLIDATALEPPPSVDALIAEFGRPGAGDYEKLLDRVRLDVGERRFALGVQLLSGTRDPIAVGEGYGRVAEAAIAVLAGAAAAEFEAAHGKVPGGELVILALGRMGGGVLTHASDLDLIYLFTGDFLVESDGRRPLGATTYFQRLAQRVTAALSAPTASGPLYEVDTRLRPSGAQGLLAVSIESFQRYEAEDAWTWEHMALARARPLFGSAAARGQLQAVIDATLRRERDPVKLTADAARMRDEIAKHKPPAGPLDVKLIEGGLVDAEFAVHTLQLRDHIGFSPRLAEAARTLEAAGKLASGFDAAAALMTRMLIMLRLLAGPDGAPGSASQGLMAEACGYGAWEDLLAAYEEARVLIGGEWRRIAQGC
ncbi:glutamate-ammonia-ligase adenylyltransferase [Sphingomonas vulcanisoli]|uniref:Glutamate-ammonia-ligase adenylyltransferase n=1 Tax=Sphingomonas vulcanisoli TaxID=1658060 RepID=A0ABX0TVM2_9SPHN|nr:bifunctional [glutamine synthetase] adenylyltransferase/[glutamine synthetase]-adenylyl-L-tyrosine phosphorylase [Sphingomonas vulcanisoli]NIJ07646.1 glutamate-ammonia-ligase adenylyltransferase [Sphingomonas vulcanisoli]